MENLLLSEKRYYNVNWNSTYSLGIKIIDDQHIKIMDFASNLLNETPKNEEEECEYFKGVIGQVVDYIKIHFATEEGVMLATRFPGYEEHKKAHEEFILTVVKSIKDYEAGNRQVLVNFSNYTKKWVLTHITLLDVKYIEYFKRITIRKKDVKMYIRGLEVVPIF